MNSTLPSAADLRHQQRLYNTLTKRTAKLAASIDDIFTPEPRGTSKVSSGAGGMTELVPIRTESDGIDFSAPGHAHRAVSQFIFAEVEPRPPTDWSDFDVTTTSNASSTQPTRTFYEPADWDEDEDGIEMTEMESTDASTSSLPFTGDEPILPLADTTSDAPSMDTF